MGDTQSLNVCHCEILGSYLQQHHQHHVVRAQFEVEPPSWAQACTEQSSVTEVTKQSEYLAVM